ncbi:MAG TPA: polysaccharide biosynthesis tyrosine autokinase [Trebonia sp.]|nr:polysaccharide biosynthesis tyrosine autokinase [Trebonia sp.]
MPNSGAEPTLISYLQVIRRRRWWVIALGAIGLALSLSAALTGQKQYAATAQLLVAQPGAISSVLGYNQAPVTTTDVQTELQLITSAQVQAQVRTTLGDVPSVSAAEVGQTNVIAVTAVSPAPARAALVANTYARAFVAARTAATSSNLAAAATELTGQINAITAEIKQLPSKATAQLSALTSQEAVLKGQLAQLQVAGSVANTGLEFVAPAQAPTSPSSPKPVQDALIGLIAGLVLGLGGAFLRDNLDDSLTSGEAVERETGAPVLATVPLVSSWRRNAVADMVANSEPTSIAAEAYRSLRTSLQFARQDRELRSFLVTSPSAGDGKTATVVNLGAVFAHTGEKVVMVMCDLRRPQLAAVPPGAADYAELSAVLAGHRSLEEALVPVAGTEGLWSLSTRTVTANPTELLNSRRMRDVLSQLSERFDVVLIDSPPILPVADAMILTSHADAVLLVVASGQTRRADLRRASEKLAKGSAPVVGVVLNKAATGDDYRGRGYGGYGYLAKPNGRPRRVSTSALSSWTSPRRSADDHEMRLQERE